MRSLYQIRQTSINGKGIQIMRVCTLCKQAKPLSEFNKKTRYHDGLDPWCKACKHEKDKARYWLDPAGAKKRSAEYAKANPDKAKAWKKASADKHRSNIRKKRNSDIKELSDKYVKQLFTENSTLTFADIPQCLVYARRELIKLKRELNKCKIATN